jgi:hypothetical protein
MLRVAALIFAFLPTISIGSNDDLETPWTELKAMLDCSPDTLALGETLTITLGINHGKELAVSKHNDNSWHFMVVGLPPDDMKSFMSPAEYKEAKTIKISTETTAYEWKHDGKNEINISAPGRYSFYVSDILESEVGGYVCHVQVTSR